MEVNLVEAMKKEMESGSRMTFDEFYDKYGIPKRLRFDFGTAALLNQVFKIEEDIK